jgi:DNA-binding NarL/FixJ family response regulator
VRTQESWLEKQTRRLTDPLRVLVDGAPPVLEGWIAELKDALSLERAAAYGVRVEPGGFAMDQTYALGFHLEHNALVSEMNALVGGSRRWGYFNPARPEPTQRNRPVAIGPGQTAWEQLLNRPSLLRSRFGMDAEAQRAMAATVDRSLSTFRRLGIADLDQIRTLACEGESLLFWVGVYRDRAFTPEELRLLAAVTPALTRRLSLERMLGSSQVTSLALTAALEEISRPAYLLNASGAVVLANALGRAELDRALEATRTTLAEVVRPGAADERFRVTPVGGPGLSRHVLVVEQKRQDPSGLAQVAAQRWGLTRREREVLEQISLGRANKSISSALGCSDKTVELHVTRLLRKTEVESRAALIAKLWRQHG